MTALVARRIEIADHTGLILAVLSPYLLLAVPAAGVVYVLRRRWAPATGALVATVILAVILSPPRPDTVVAAATVRVMSTNLLEGRADSEAVVDLARRHADVVAVQELTPDGLKGLSANGIDAEFPHRIVKPLDGGSGAGLWSRHPLHATGDATSEAVPIIATLDVPGIATPPVVANVHLSAPWPWTIEWWRADIAQVTDILTNLRTPAVVAGDFNSTWDMAQFRSLLGPGYRDAAGRFAPTYPADSRIPPLLAIDHILVRGCSGSRAWTATVPGTDHRALLAQVQLPG